MSIYVPEIVEEVSENAKFLMEDGGKIVRVGDHPKGGNGGNEGVNEGIEFLYVVFDCDGNVLNATDDLYNKVDKLFKENKPFNFAFYRYEPEIWGYRYMYIPSHLAPYGDNNENYSFQADGGYFCNVTPTEIRWNESD